MSDSEDHAGPAEKAPQNEACTNCRAVKRRCLNNGDHTPCVRCSKQSLDCRYHQEKRGRKAGPGGSRPRKRRTTQPPSSSEPPERETQSVVGTQAPTAGAIDGGRDWLAEMLQQQVEGPAASTSSAAFPAHPQPAAYPAHIPSTSYLPPPPPGSVPPPAHSLPSLAAAIPPFPHPAFPSSAPNPSTSALPPPPPHAVPSSRPSAYPPPSYPSAPQSNGPSPAAASASASSPGGPGSVQATPATGGFSLIKILKENHAGGVDGGERSPPRHSLADAFAPEADRKTLGNKPEKVFEDIVDAGIMAEENVAALFDFYFLHLNPMTSLLDPQLHTISFVRQRSAILFTAILTVASKVALPALYPPSLKYARALLGSAFEVGVNNLELVQAIATIVFWADPTDDSGARKLAYAIRCALELGIHKQAKRPLPDDELERRKVLNVERTWLYMTIADHRFNTQRGLPKMIGNDLRRDAVPWLLEHGPDFCPQEAGLIPLLELGRILDIYAVLISPPEDGLPSMELLKCCEREVEAWKGNWSLDRASIPLQPAQSSLVRFYAQVLQWQLGEVNLSVAIRKTAEQLDNPTPATFDPKESPLVLFKQVVNGAIKVLDAMERELQFMVYSFDSMWVGTASSAIWLTQNLSGMEHRDRQLSLAAISRLQNACTAHSSSPQSMAAYTSRLLSHLLNKVKAADTAAAQPAAPDAPALANGVASVAPSQPAPFVTASLSAPTWSTDANPFGVGSGGSGINPASNGYGTFSGASVPAGGINGTRLEGMGAGAAAPAHQQPPPVAQHQQQQQTWSFDPLGGGAAQQQQQMPGYDPLATNFLGSMVPPLQGFGEDLPFPAADDALWQSLFPLFANES